jgi:transposase
LISESDRKNDKADSRTLARLAHAAPDLLAPIHHRSEQVQVDLATIKARDAVIRSRTALISAIRGIIKSTGSRLAVCSTGVFAKTAMDSCPAALRDALLPLMHIVQELTNEIRAYDKAITKKAEKEYPETAAILTIPGVGPLTALTFVLLLNNDPHRIPKSRDLGCYFGLQPRQQDSGKHVSQLGITKAGDGLMRKLAVQCAHFMLGKIRQRLCFEAMGFGAGRSRWKECEEACGCCRRTETAHSHASPLEDTGELRSVLWLCPRTTRGLNDR